MSTDAPPYTRLASSCPSWARYFHSMSKMHSKKVHGGTSRYCPSVTKRYRCCLEEDSGVTWPKKQSYCQSPANRLAKTWNHSEREIPRCLLTSVPALLCPTILFILPAFQHLKSEQNPCFEDCPLFYFVLRRVWVHLFCSNPSLAGLPGWQVLTWLALHFFFFIALSFCCLLLTSSVSLHPDILNSMDILTFSDRYKHHISPYLVMFLWRNSHFCLD